MASKKLVEIRDRSGKLLFKYNPEDNSIEMRKGGDVYSVIKLDEIRQRYGYLTNEQSPLPLGVEFIEKEATAIVTQTGSNGQ